MFAQQLVHRQAVRLAYDFDVLILIFVVLDDEALRLLVVGSLKMTDTKLRELVAAGDAHRRTHARTGVRRAQKCDHGASILQEQVHAFDVCAFC